MRREPYYTIKLTFNVSGGTASKLLATAWRFKAAAHRVLITVKAHQEYELILNKRYSYGVACLVYEIGESARELGIDFRQVELG